MVIVFIGGIEISMVTEYMAKYLNPEGTFLVFSFITFLSIFFFEFKVKETKGLNDIQKKKIYDSSQSCVKSGS